MIALRDSGKSFELSLNGRVVLRHSKSDPCIAVGRERVRITTKHGMYSVRRIGRRTWSAADAYRVLGHGPASIIVEFTGIGRLEASTEGQHLAVGFKAENPDMTSFSMRIQLDPAESVAGCGEQFSRTDLRKRKFPIWVSEPGVGRGVNYVKALADIHSGRGGSFAHTYFPLPGFVTSGGQYCLARVSSYSEFDFRSEGVAALTFRQIPEAIHLGAAATQQEAIGQFSSILGRQAPLPEWAYEGLWLGAQGGRETVQAKLDVALGAGINVKALWCQDWQGIRMTPYGKQLFWNWDYDRSLYPELPRFIEALHERGIRMFGYNNPFLAQDAPQFAEAAAKGYLVKKADGGVYTTTTTTFPVGMLDLSNPEARAWMKSIIRENLLAVGLDGWMADFGEYLPAEAALHSGEDASLRHNPYPVEWARLNAEAVAEAGRAGMVPFFCRSGYSGSSVEAPLFWAGDQLVNFMPDAGLPAALAAGISAGMSGIGNWHFDIGGFLSLAWITRSKAHFLRSAEFAAFTQVMRTHEGINPRVNHQFDSDAGTLAHLARMVRVHDALKPYHLHAAAEYQSSGLPPIRPVSLHYAVPGKPGARPCAYLYGRDLFVAPVLGGGERRRRISLPDDDWVHLWSGRHYRGGTVRIPAPFGEPPVFWRRESRFAELFSSIPASAAGQISAN